jgi:hypothetical protein
MLRQQGPGSTVSSIHDSGNPLMNAFTNITQALGAPLTSPPEDRISMHAMSTHGRRMMSFAESPRSPRPATARAAAAKQTNSAHISPYSQQGVPASSVFTQMFSSPPSPVAPHHLQLHSPTTHPRQHSIRPSSNPGFTTPTQQLSVYAARPASSPSVTPTQHQSNRPSASNVWC